MTNKKILVSLVAILALVFAIANVSAVGNASIGLITGVEISGVDVIGTSAQIAPSAGDTLPVRVQFLGGDTDSSDAVMKVWISGAKDYSVSSDRFKVFSGSTYSKLFAVQMPFNIDETEELFLNILVEGKNARPVIETIPLKAQRESYIVEILDVNMNSKVEAGSSLTIDIVLKNRGLELAEDTFVKISIPALGVNEKSYFGDMSAIDQNEPSEKEDASERRLILSIPSDAKPGVYAVEIEAYNGDASTILTKKLAIVGDSDNSMIVSALNSKTFSANEVVEYTLTLVNSGNKIKVYELVPESSSENLDVTVDEAIVAVPAGMSKTVKIAVSASKADDYSFAVNVQSNGDLVKKEVYTAHVEGSSAGKAFSGSTGIVLTVVLAIIFVVLLIVLIVLLTRKPEKTSEIGESYY